MLILEKESFPKFPRKNSDQRRKRAAAPGDDDPPHPPSGAEKLFYREVPSDRDTRMRRRPSNSDQMQTSALKLLVSFVSLTNGCFGDSEAAA